MQLATYAPGGAMRKTNIQRGVAVAIAVSIGAVAVVGCGSTVSGEPVTAAAASPQVPVAQGTPITTASSTALSAPAGASGSPSSSPASGADGQGLAFGDWIDIGEPGERVTVHRTVEFTEAGGKERLAAEIERCAGPDERWLEPPQPDNWFVDALDGSPLLGDTDGPLVAAPGSAAGGVVLRGECTRAWVYFDRAGETANSLNVKLRTTGGELVVWRGPVQPESSLNDNSASVQPAPSSQPWEARETPTLRADLKETGLVTGQPFSPEGLTLTLESAMASPAGQAPKRVAVELAACVAPTANSFSLPTLSNLRLKVLDKNDETYGRQGPELATIPARAGGPLGPGMADPYVPGEIVLPGECSTGWVSFDVGDADLTRLAFQIYYNGDAQVQWSI